MTNLIISLAYLIVESQLTSFGTDYIKVISFLFCPSSETSPLSLFLALLVFYYDETSK